MRLTSFAFALLSLLVSGCSDDDAGGADASLRKDVGIRDSASGADQAAPDRGDDSSPSVDGAGELLNCNQVTACQEACGVNLTCINACTAKGCASAKTVANALTTCATSPCGTLCLADPSATACKSCVEENCGDELSACQVNTCP